MATPIVPTPNSSSLVGRAARLTTRTRALLTAMNLHYAGVAALLVVVLYLLVHAFFVWQALGASGPAALEQQRVELKAAEVAAKPLRGLDAKLVDSTKEADAFYARRLPYAYSQVAAELGALTKRQGVRLTRVQYAQAGVLSGSAALTEVRMDASVSGDYRPVVQFINAAERDKMFFILSSINLTGQQTGQVNLRIRLVTYLRPANEGEMRGELPPDEGDDDDDAPAGGAR